MSTCRMLLRFADWGSTLSWFLGKLDSMLKAKFNINNESGLEWTMNIMDLVGSIADNFVYLNRVKLRTYKNKWEEIWIDWLSSACCITFILLSMVQKLQKIYQSSVKDLANISDVCYNRDSSGGSLVDAAETDSSGNEVIP